MILIFVWCCTSLPSMDKEQDLLNSTIFLNMIVRSDLCNHAEDEATAPALGVFSPPSSSPRHGLCRGPWTLRLSLVRSFAKCTLTRLQGARGWLTETRRAWGTWGSRHTRNSCHSWRTLLSISAIFPVAGRARITWNRHKPTRVNKLLISRRC